MSLIRATCQATGATVDLPPAIVDLTVLLDNWWFGFHCAACSDYHVEPCNEEVADLLQSGDVELRVVQYPAELDEQHTGKTINGRDIGRFVRQLFPIRHVSAVAAQEVSK